MNSLSFIHAGNSVNVMVRYFFVTGWEKDKASMSSPARKDCLACRWRRGVDMNICEAPGQLRATSYLIERIRYGANHKKGTKHMPECMAAALGLQQANPTQEFHGVLARTGTVLLP